LSTFNYSYSYVFDDEESIVEQIKPTRF